MNGSGHARRALHIGLLCLAACGGDTGTGGGAPSFTDVTEAAGIDFVHVHGGVGRKYLFETMGSGVAAADFDGDELPDLLFLQSGTLPTDEFPLEERGRDDHQVAEGNRLYRNLGDGTFEDVTAGSGLDVPFYAQGLAVGDVDSDGDRDIYVGAYGRSRLFLNDGNARFTDVSETCGIDDPIWTIGGAFLDADGDGDLDLYSVAYLDMPYDTHRFCGPSRQLRTYCHV
ncbi:MAG: FG-GAP repeat domain-containing protein, partial [Planctomycetota bacterium]